MYAVCKSHGSLVQGMYELSLKLIRGVRVRGNMNLIESKFKKFGKKMYVFFYPSLPHVINHDIFITPP